MGLSPGAVSAGGIFLALGLTASGTLYPQDHRHVHPDIVTTARAASWKTSMTATTVWPFQRLEAQAGEQGLFCVLAAGVGGGKRVGPAGPELVT